MKILWLSNMYPSKEMPFGGIFLKKQYEELLETIKEDDQLDYFYMKRVRTSKLGSANKYFKAFLRFIPYLFKRYDIIHVHYFYPMIIFGYLKKLIDPSTRLLVTFHGSDINIQVNSSNQWFFRIIARKIDHSMPVGDTLASVVREKLEIEKITIIPVGVDDKVFYKLKEKCAKNYDFLNVGYFTVLKGLDTIISAIKKIPPEKGVKYCFCGNGPLENELRELKNTGYSVDVKLNQSHEELREIMNRSRFLLSMSRHEGFPTVTLEAFFCGVPALTSGIENFREQIREGVNGFTVPVGDVEKLKARLLELQRIDNNYYQKLVNGALSSHREHSLENVCKKIYRLYKNEASLMK